MLLRPCRNMCVMQCCGLDLLLRLVHSPAIFSALMRRNSLNALIRLLSAKVTLQLVVALPLTRRYGCTGVVVARPRSARPVSVCRQAPQRRRAYPPSRPSLSRLGLWWTYAILLTRCPLLLIHCRLLLTHCRLLLTHCRLLLIHYLCIQEHSLADEEDELLDDGADTFACSPMASIGQPHHTSPHDSDDDGDHASFAATPFAALTPKDRSHISPPPAPKADRARFTANAERVVRREKGKGKAEAIALVEVGDDAPASGKSVHWDEQHAPCDGAAAVDAAHEDERDENVIMRLVVMIDAEMRAIEEVDDKERVDTLGRLSSLSLTAPDIDECGREEGTAVSLRR